MQNLKTITAAFILTLLGFAIYSVGFASENKEFKPGEDSGFYYTIKKGDTLWDLSQKFYNSKWDWPGLWEINDDIKNPHWIYPGKKIQIFLKGKAPLPPKIVTVRKLTKEKVPARVDTSFSYSAMNYTGFIKKEQHPTLGIILQEQEGNIMMSEDDILYIKPSSQGELKPGVIYQIFGTSRVNEKVNGQNFTGIKHLIKAEIKILEHKGEYVTGKILRADRSVFKGDFIMEYYERDSVLTVEESPTPIDARIIGSEDDTLMINDYRIAFINTGKAHVKPGQMYTILRNPEDKDYKLWKSKDDESMEFEKIKSGKLIILHTEDTASTVMIMSSKYAIRPDDIVK
jgi:hypothetical protein